MQITLSDETQRALIVGLTTSIPAIIAAYFSYRAKVISEKTEHNTNHLKDELVAAVSAERFAAGQKQEKDNPT